MWDENLSPFHEFKLFFLVYFHSGGLAPPQICWHRYQSPCFLNYLQSKAKIFRPQLLRKKPPGMRPRTHTSPPLFTSSRNSGSTRGRRESQTFWATPTLMPSFSGVWDQKAGRWEIKSGHTETARDALLCGGIVTLHARLFKTLFPKSLMEIGSFSKHNDE